MFCSRVGTPLSQLNVIRFWERVLERAGVERRGFHHLRHTYGTALAERKVHERVTQELLGHVDSRTTRESYTHVTEQMHDEATEAVTDAFGEALDPRLGPLTPSTSRPMRQNKRERACDLEFGWRAGRIRTPTF